MFITTFLQLHIFLKGRAKEITTITSSGHHSTLTVTNKFELNDNLGATFVSILSNVIVNDIIFEVISSISFFDW